MKKTIYITDLDSAGAMDFLLKSTSYHGFELPEYFDFDEILKFVKQRIGDKAYDDCINSIGPAEVDNVNFDIMLNKDGKYAVRPLMLCNPYLYYFLAREICGKDNWDTIREHFRSCRSAHITSCAIPVIPNKNEKFHKSTTILNWWNLMEQRSIELSLEYRYMFVSDITNCYGTVNPSTIDWALSRKSTKVATDSNHKIAANIMRYLCDFQQGKNIGIPQGSMVFDIIGEIILSYSDLLFYEALERADISDGYEVLRYRDDYKIFCNDKDKLESISYILQDVLESLNFRMNSTKTFISDSIITDAIKPDKLFYIFNTPIFNKKGCDFDGLQKHLLYILMFSRKYPNAGQLRTMLNNFDDRVRDMLEEPSSNDKDSALEDILLGLPKSKQKKESVVVGKIYENIRAMCAITTQIAAENLSVVHYALKVISRMTSSMKNTDDRDDIIKKVYHKLVNQPNSTYSKLWLQNMTYNYDVAHNDHSKYDVRLCKIVMGESVELWNNSWLKPELLKGFAATSVVNKKTLGKVTPIITFRERRQYWDGLDDDIIDAILAEHR